LLCFCVCASPIQAQLAFGGGGTPHSAQGGESLFPPSCGAGSNLVPGLSNPLNLYVGWLDHAKGNTWTLQRQQSSGTASWPVRGWWLGASTDFALSYPIGVLVAGYVFFPQRSAGTWYEDPPSRSFDFEVPSYDWWTVEGFLTGSLCGNLEILAGFRWNHTSIRINYSDFTDDDYILNTTTPLVGVQYRGQSSAQRILVRVVGSPVIGGNLNYHFWDNLGFAEFGSFPVRSGSFLECMADYSVQVADRFGLGCFVKWNVLRVRTDEKDVSGSAVEPIYWSVDNRAWIVGASASLAFVSPF
jgi:hypothetical protein